MLAHMTLFRAAMTRHGELAATPRDGAAQTIERSHAAETSKQTGERRPAQRLFSSCQGRERALAIEL